MAKSRDNVVMQGASGRVGRNLVFRQKGDQTIIAKRPRSKSERKYSPDQKRVMNKFTRAALYATSAIEDPQIKEVYQAKANINQSAYNVAFKDYIVEPEVALLDDIDYQGNPDDQITLLVKDVLKVVKVEIEILDQDDTIIESGEAQATNSAASQWTYTVTQDNPDYQNVKYRITMRDTPNKKTTVIKKYGEDATY